MKEQKHEIAYKEIKEKIINREYTESTSISINTLSKQMNMSISPIRDALKKLQEEGFVRIIPNQGIYVRELSATEVAEMYDLRLALEEFIIRKVHPFLQESDYSDLEAMIQEQRKAFESGDDSSFLKTDNEFHNYFNKYFQNSMILNTLARLEERLFHIWLRSLQVPGRMEASIEEHERVLSALKNNEIEKAFVFLEVHLQKGLFSGTSSL